MPINREQTPHLRYPPDIADQDAALFDRVTGLVHTIREIGILNMYGFVSYFDRFRQLAHPLVCADMLNNRDLIELFTDGLGDHYGPLFLARLKYNEYPNYPLNFYNPFEAVKIFDVAKLIYSKEPLSSSLIKAPDHVAAQPLRSGPDSQVLPWQDFINQAFADIMVQGGANTPELHELYLRVIYGPAPTVTAPCTCENKHEPAPCPGRPDPRTDAVLQEVPVVDITGDQPTDTTTFICTRIPFGSLSGVAQFIVGGGVDLDFGPDVQNAPGLNGERAT